MTTKTTHLTHPTLAPLRRALLCSTAIDAIAIGTGMIDLAKAPVLIADGVFYDVGNRPGEVIRAA